MLLSFLCPLTDMMCRASNPLLSRIVMVVALIEWFAYIVDNSACCELSCSCRECSRRQRQPCCHTKFLLHQIFGRWKRYSFIGFKALKYFSKDETGQKGPSFAIIIPPSSAWTSCSLWFFVSSSFIFTTQRIPCELTFISKSVFLNWRRFYRPGRWRNNSISKKTLFCRVVEDTLKPPHRYNFFMSSSAIGVAWAGLFKAGLT